MGIPAVSTEMCLPYLKEGFSSVCDAEKFAIYDP